MADPIPDPRLCELIDDAMQVMRNSRWHDLGFSRQQAIWWQLSAGLAPEDGHRRRALLAIASVRHVLPVWRRAHPYSDLAARALFLAEGVLDGRVPHEDGEQFITTLTTELDDLTAGAEGGWVWAGYGAVVALDQAIDDLTYLNGPPLPIPATASRGTTSSVRTRTAATRRSTPRPRWPAAPSGIRPRARGAVACSGRGG